MDSSISAFLIFSRNSWILGSTLAFRLWVSSMAKSYFARKSSRVRVSDLVKLALLAISSRLHQSFFSSSSCRIRSRALVLVLTVSLLMTLFVRF